MNARTEFTKRQAFAALWNFAHEPSHYDVGVVREWLKDEGWPTLFPGHCFRCHGFEDGPCEAPEGHGPFACPGCVKEEQGHAQAVKMLQAKMDKNEALWAVLEGKGPLEEMAKLAELDINEDSE